MIVEFGNNESIRKKWHNGEWYYSIVDVVAVLLDLDVKEAKNYHYNLKKRIEKESGVNGSYTKLKLTAVDGKNYLTEVVNDEQALRLIMSIPSPKAESLKLWLAHIGMEALQQTGKRT